MIGTETYEHFLVGAASGLALEGSQAVLPRGADPLPWAEGWDQIIMTSGPGPLTLYAFTRDPGGDLARLQERIERLAGGLSERGILSGSPVELVALVSLPSGAAPEVAKRVAQLAPKTYYAGLRPDTWAVDLAEGAVITRRRLGRPDRLEIIEAAARQARGGALVDPVAVERHRLDALRRSEAFQELMRGRQPVVTYGLIALNVAIFLLMYLRHGLSADGGIPASVLQSFGAMSGNLVLRRHEWYRLVTAIFLHASIQHILFNMTSLFAVGVLAERLYGSVKFLAIYLGAGLIGSLCSVVFSVSTGQMDVLGVGASGAIFGVAGALVSVRFQRSEVIPPLLRRRVSNAMIPLVGLSLLIAYLTPYVDNAAHVGGLLGGVGLSFLFPLTRRLPHPVEP